MSLNFTLQTIAIIKGNYQLPPVLAVILRWIEETYSVDPINVEFQTHGTLYSQSITIVLSKKSDIGKMWAHCDAIKDKFFAEIFKTENRAVLEAHGNILRLRSKKIPEATFGFMSIDQISLQHAILQVGNRYEKLMGSYPDLLWNVRYAEGHFIIFYFTDLKQKEADENGTTDKILNELVQLLKPYDDLNLITIDMLMESRAIQIDSKENYDNNFGGADWMYFR